MGTIFYTMVIGRKVDGLRHISASLITMNIETEESTNPNWIMGGRVDGMIPTYIASTSSLAPQLIKEHKFVNRNKKQQINPKIYQYHMVYER